jgi:hypothetical protein
VIDGVCLLSNGPVVVGGEMEAAKVRACIDRGGKGGKLYNGYLVDDRDGERG